MHELLFRGQQRRKGEKVYLDGSPVEGSWFYGNGVLQGKGDFSIIYQTEPKFEKHSVYTDTLGQYTGLTDKNGNKIFEGDIFKFNDEVWESYYTACGTEYDSYEVKNYGVVGFDEDRSCFDFVQYKFNENSVEADLHENYDIEFADFISELEVIGNIYDNPELLKGE